MSSASEPAQEQHVRHEQGIRVDALDLQKTVQSRENHGNPSWHFRVDSPHFQKTAQQQIMLLHDLSLVIPPSSFIALVGGSGVGKSTLMYALSGIQPASQGTVLYNGQNYAHHLAAFRAQIGYVPQDDILHRRLIVKHALYYAARMRLPQSLTKEQIYLHIDEVLKDVGMQHRSDFLINNLSGGERKRVSIALELLASPSIFFLDEPTSGLDPGLDYRMMHLLRDLADAGRTIVLVTHTVLNIELCDRVCFLARGGRLTYYGAPEEAQRYFETENFAAIYTRLEPTDEQPDIPERAEKRFRQSPLYQQYVHVPLEKAQQEAQAVRSAPEQRTPHVSAWRQFCLLSLRYLELLKNDTGSLLLLLLQAPIIGIILWYLAASGAFAPTSVVTCPTRANILARTGPIVSVDCQRVVNLLNGPQGATIAQQRGISKEQVLQNAIQPSSGSNAQVLLFSMGFAAILFGCINGAREIVKEVPIYRRERMVNMGLWPYLFSKIVILGVLSLLQSFVLVVLINLKAPFQSGILFPGFLEISLTMALTSLAGLMLGLAVSALAPNTDRAMTLVPLILVPQVIFAGVLFPLTTPFLQGVGAFFATRWAMAAMGSSVGLHAKPLGVDSFAYKGTLFVSLHPASSYPDAVTHLLLVWGALVAMIVVLGGITAYFIKRKDVQR